MKLLELAGLDIGNGYVKGGASVNGSETTSIDFASGAAYITNPNDIKASEDEIGNVIGDIFNHMDVSFDSPLIKDSARRIFGRRGIQTGAMLEEFDVYSSISKAKQQLSFILVLGCVAGRALQDYWANYHTLPKDILSVRARVALALPISEFKSYRKEYAEDFKNHTHMVCIHNFEQPVRMELTFADVQVIAEGASAQYAINAKGLPLMNAMLADLRNHGEALPGVTAEDVLAARNTVGVDIGEGTVNFPVFQDGKFNPDASLTFGKGYGTVLTTAMDRLQDQGFPFDSRKALVSFLQSEPTNISRNRYQRVARIVEEDVNAFAKEVSSYFSKVLSRTGAFTEVVYVYGGGASKVKEVLYPMLINMAKTFGGEDIGYPILYLDSRYSRYLNSEGLYLMAESAYQYDVKHGKESVEL